MGDRFCGFPISWSLPIWLAASVVNQRGGHEAVRKGNYAAIVKQIAPQSFHERDSHGQKPA
jgi:hypothetical protein